MRLRLAAFTVCALALSATASAQTATIRTFGSRASGSYTRAINAKECADNIVLTFTVAEIAAGATLAVYYGTNCELGMNRVDTSTSDPVCTLVTNESLNSLGTQDISFTAQELDCNKSPDLDESRNVYFLALSATTDAKDLTLGTDAILFTPPIEIDTEPPPPPLSVDGGSGETSNRIEWDLPSDEIKEFVVYWELTDDCDVTTLAAGQAAPTGFSTKEDGISASSTSVILSDVLGANERAAVAVVAVDDADNESVLSNVSCIEWVPTTSWLDLHEMQGGKTGSTCSVATFDGAHASMLALWSMLIALLALRASRRVS